ncbi:serine hydrolase [Mucilaginibacter sp.]|jgi:CubicO group peptidase (beta-lactamase class C family)|uniref:serine hydrolase n=1 Tax=Mucilaginibacter sp. TaxID=1882438 RepID=UPI003567E6D1
MVFVFPINQVLAQPNPNDRVLKNKKIDSLMNTLYERGQFTGAILITDHGHVLYKKAFGMADREHRKPYSLNTPGYLQSLSKPITAMGIMILKERGKLRYEQSIRNYLPDLPSCMQAVTIRNLLQHTGGLEGFEDFPDMTEQDVFKIMQKQTVLKFEPGSKFEYSNAGYTLLGMIIQKISGQSLNGFLTQNIFSPLGMHNTAVTELQHRIKVRAIGYDLFGSKNDADSFEGGCASIISTVGDIAKFDESLYTYKLVSKQTQEEAFAPSIPQKDDIYGDRSYGFGWWVSTHNGKRNIFHNGSSYGFKAYDEILMGEHINIIHISNLRHSVMFSMRTAIINILNGKPYDLPPRGIGPWIYTQTKAQGIDSAITLYNRIKMSSNKNDFNYAESELNTLGYYLLRSGHEQDAIKIFSLNTITYPGSFNAYDSLGEAYLKIGDKAQGLANYKRSLELNPNNEDLKRRIAAVK